jgi:hypothetical protein
MALTISVLNLITDGNGTATKEFLVKSPEAWASEQIIVRYGQTILPSDSPGCFAKQCWNFLREEYIALRSWFSDDGTLSPLLQSKFLSTRLSGPLNTGISWDFKTDGQPEPRALLFKGTLIAAQRAAELIPAASKTSGCMQFGGISKIVRSAYTSRAELHLWCPQTIMGEGANKITYSGAEMSRRWVSFRSYNFLIGIGGEQVWAWDSSHCRSLFGPIDESSLAY